MDRRYEAYCFADPLFYDSAATLPPRESFAIAQIPAPPGWHREDRDVWVVLRPPGTPLPAQGWKIHVSACLDSADNVLALTYDYCVQKQIAFKFLRSRIVVLSSNSKYAARGSSGKLITIYPVSETQLEQTLIELGRLLDGQQGPYILSDLRWGSGPLHVRFGGFAERYSRRADGEKVPAIERPDGSLVEDVRGPVFAMPPWVQLPGFLRPHLQARTSATLDGFPFRIDRALHFSNGGGVYLAHDPRTGQPVVVKEARPHAGLDRTGADAVTRLRREHDVLRRLSATGVTPAVLDFRTCWEHHYLVTEYVEGQQLNRELVGRYPLIHPDVDEADVGTYTKWALGVADGLAAVLRAIHGCGLVYGDLHPDNVLVRPDGQLSFVDFELAAPVGSIQRPGLGAFGFGAPAWCSGFDVDRYALACVQLWLFLPLTELLRFSTTKVDELTDAIVERFPVPHEYLERIRAALRPAEVPQALAPGGQAPPRIPRWQTAHTALARGEPDWPELRASVSEGIYASATAERTDRLFPGDIEQFSSGGLGIAFGAAGVLWALHTVGVPRNPEHERWLLDGCRRSRPRPGLYTGMHGVAYVLHQIGLADEAASLLDRLLDLGCDGLGPGLLSGLSGTGLVLLHFAQVMEDRACYEAAVEAAQRLMPALRQHGGAGSGYPGPPGLMLGASGPALLFIRLYEHAGERQFLDLAEVALRRDLARCISMPDGTLQADDVTRVLPYVARGSAGIGMVLQDYLGHRGDPELAGSAAAIQRAAEPEVVAQAGLFLGRAGLLAHLSRLRHTAAGDGEARARLNRVTARHVARLSWHAVPYRGCLAFPGDQSLRLSSDLATGSAGVLLAVHAALHGGPVLPFLAAPPPTPPAHVPKS
jgi:tRNA A-37 threonylcarbamoyl transferase component Bud32